MVGTLSTCPFREVKHVAHRLRHIRCGLLCLVALAVIPPPPLTAQNPEFDLLIKGGHLLDPKNGINAVMDVAVSGGKVALVASSIANARAREVADAGGMYVTPGLIDIHAHVFWGHDGESQRALVAQG